MRLYSRKARQFIEGPVLDKLNETSKQSYPLKVVAMLLMDNYDYTKIARNVKSSTTHQTNEKSGDSNVMTAHKMKDDLFVTSSGTMVTSAME